MIKAKRNSPLLHLRLSELSHGESEDGEEVYLFDLLNKSSVVDESKDSSPPSPACGWLGQ